MSKKIRLGYDILSKRATETESGVNIDEALKKITSYKKVPGTGDDNHPDEPRPSTKVIYIVKVDGASQPDSYKEWIWNQPVDGVGNWECIGGTSDDANSWKRWSENRGSSGEGESVYLGVNDVANRDETYVLGKGNTVSVTDETDYTSTDVVEIGSENTATDAANTYQLGRENTVTGNNLANKERYPHSMAMNLGRNNSITGEGVNIGKDNVSSTFGVAIGQRNQATDASIAIGEDVDSYSGSISIGHGKPSANSGTLPILSMTVDGEEIPAQKIKLDLTEYTYYDIASVFKTASNTYEWGEVGEFSTRVTLYENQALHTYLVGGNSASSGRVTGYFDSNGNFISATDPSYNIKEYSHITAVNGVPVDFYCSRENGTTISVSGYFKKSETQPDYGTVLNASEYAEWLSKLSISDATYTNINVYTADLSAPAMKCYDSGTNRPFYTQYSVYGYRDDNNNFIPYNDVTKYKSNAFTWETIPADELHASELDPAVVGYEAPKTISRNDSIAIGKSVEADTSSFGIGIGTLYPQVMYERESDAGGWIGYTDTRYKTLTISQVDGSVAQSDWITYNRVWFNYTVDDVSWSASSPSRTVMGNSIAIVNTGSSSSYNNYLSGASVGIGNGLKLTDNSFGFGTNLEGDNNSVLVGSSLTSQVGGSTIVGRYISVKLGDSDNDGGTINGEYDGGLVAFGMSISPAPGSVTIGSNGVTTGRGSLAVGLSGITAKHGSIVYGRNGISADGSSAVFGVDGTNAVGRSMALGLSSGISAKYSGLAIGLDGSVLAESCALAIGVREGYVHAFANAMAIGLGAYSTTGSGTTSVNAACRSVAIGIGDISASYNSMVVGKDGEYATAGGMAFGKTSYIADQGMGFGTGLDTKGGFVFGCGVTARSAGLSIGTTSIGSDSNANPYRIGTWNNTSGVSASLFAYENPDGQYVPLKGYVVPTNGSMSCGAYYKNITNDGTVYPYAIVENNGSTNNNPMWWDYNQQTWISLSSGNDFEYRKSREKIYYGLIHSYVDSQNKTVYEVIDVPYYDKLNENSSIVTTYFAVEVDTFVKDNQTYVFGTGLGYDTYGTSQYPLTRQKIALNDAKVSVINQNWTPGVLGYYPASSGDTTWIERWKDDFSPMSTTASVTVGGGAAHHTSFAFGQYAQSCLDYPSLKSIIHSSGSGSYIPHILEITKTNLSDNRSIKLCNDYGNTSDTQSILVGISSNNVRWRSIIIGQQYNFAEGTSFIAGIDNNIAVSRSVAIGCDNTASGQSMALGYSSGAFENATSFGLYTRASNGSMALGKNSDASANSVILGIDSQASKLSSVLGYNSYARDNSISVGNYCYSDDYGIAIGNGCTSVEKTMAIGHSNYAFDAGIAIGTDCSAVERAIAVGINNKMGVDNIAFGIDNSYVASSTGMAIGASNSIGNGGYNIVAGRSNAAHYEAIALGRSQTVYGWSIGIGIENRTSAVDGAHATLIGYNNDSTSNLEKLEKTIKVKYEKQEALEKEISCYTTVHNKALSIVSSYTTSSEYNTIRNYEQAMYDYYVNDGPNPGYNQEYYNIKNSLVNYPPIIMSDDAWNNWYTGYNYGYYYMAEACDYYQYYLEYHDDYYLDYYKEYRDYAYQYLPAWLDLMKTYAINNMTDDYVAILNEIIDAIADRPEIVPMDIFYTGTSSYYQSDYYKLVGEFYESYSSRSYATPGKIPGKLQYTYREYDSEASSLLYIIANIRRSGSSGVYIDEIDETPCNSILLGANNESNHYNSILIGAKNQSAKPVSEKSKTDDDGFTLAIGYRNKVSRNYDIAIGYMSEANGGENIAIQHSVAGNGNKTYHNLAMFDSTALGTGNTALQHSKVTAGYNNFALSNSTIGGSGNLALIESLADFGLSGYKSCTHNFLFHAKASGTLSSSGGLHRNVVLSAEVYGTSSVFAENFIYGGSGYSDSDYSTLNSITLNGDHSVTGNIILGHNHATTAINASTCIQNNIIMQPHGVAVDGSSFDDNVIIAGSAEVTGSYFTHNTIIGGSISGNFSVCANNMVLENSSIIGQRSGEGAFGTLGRNLLLNSSLVLSDQSSWLSGTWTATDNFLMGISASNTMSCFAFADGVDGTRGVEARLEDAVRVYNFGDNVIQRGLSIFAVGGTNDILNADKLFLFGNQNQVKGDRSSAGDSSAFSGITIIGSDNDIRHTKKVPSYGSGSYYSNGISYTNVIGNKNTVGGDNLNENWILGNVTTIHHYTDPTVITLAEFRNRVDSKQASTKIRTSEMGLVHGWTYSGSEYAYYTSYFYSGKHYYEDNMVYDGNVDGLTAVDIDVYDFINGYFAGTLTNKTLYNIKYPAGQSRAVNMQDYLPQKMYTGRMVNPDVVYNLYSGGKLESYNIATYQPDVDNAVNVLGNKLFGNDIIINAHDAMHNIILGDENFISAYEPYGLPMLNESDINAIDPNGPLVEFITVADAYVPGGKTTTSIYNNYNYFKHAGLLAEVWSYSGPKTEMSGYDFYIAFLNGTLIEDSVYHITSSYTNVPTPLPVALKLYGWKVYKKGAGIAYPEEAKDARYPESLDICNSKVPFTSLYNGTYGVHPAESVYNNLIVGTQNGIHSHIVGYSIIGAQNNVACSSTMWQQDSEFCISNGFVQGNNNIAKDGSNIISMGNGHLSTGHNSVAIGSQLISNKWQTVLGKYNEPLDGPDRLIAPENEADKALFIIGNGYSDTDGNEWQNESKIHRSNAMVVYANGDTVFSGNVNASNLPPAPSTDGRYALNCTVTNGVPSYSWVPLGTTTV